MVHDSTPVTRWKEGGVGGSYTKAAIWTLPPCQLTLREILWVCEKNDWGLTLKNSQVGIQPCILKGSSIGKQEEREKRRSIVNRLALVKLDIFKSHPTGFLKAWPLAQLYKNHPRSLIQILIPSACLQCTKLESWSIGPWSFNFQKK